MDGAARSRGGAWLVDATYCARVHGVQPCVMNFATGGAEMLAVRELPGGPVSPLMNFPSAVHRLYEQAGAKSRMSTLAVYTP